MKRPIRNIIQSIVSVIMVTLLLIVSSGFSLYSHHCSHKGEANYSIILPVEPCGCEEAEQASCCMVNPVVTCDSDCGEDCCKDEQQFSKFDVDSFTGLLQMDFSSSALDLFMPERSVDASFLSSGYINVLWQLLSEPPSPPSLNKFLSLIQVYLN